MEIKSCINEQKLNKMHIAKHRRMQKDGVAGRATWLISFICNACFRRTLMRPFSGVGLGNSLHKNNKNKSVNRRVLNAIVDAE